MAIDRVIKMKIIEGLNGGIKGAILARELGVSEDTVSSIKKELTSAGDVTPLAIDKDNNLYEPKDDEMFNHDAPVSHAEISDDDDDSDYIAGLMIGADKIVIYRNSIKVTIELDYKE